MKKSLLILAAATAVGFAACNGGNNDGSLTPAQLDSIKQVTADSVLNAQKLQSDSIANAQNALAVDSLKRINDSLAIVAGKPVPAPGKKPSKPSTGKPTPTKEEPTTNTPPKKTGLKGQSDQEKQQQNGGLRSKSDQAKQEQQRQTGGLKSKSDQAKQGE